MRIAFLLLVVSCSRNNPPAVKPFVGDVAAASTPSAALPVLLSETDFRGSFNGAKLYATLRVHEGVVSGTCFYESIGTDIDVRGTVAADGSISLMEMNGVSPVSVVVLTQGRQGTWTGTWKNAAGSKSGVATLSPIAREVGEPVTVVPHLVHKSSLAMCHSSMGTPSAPCSADARVPVVLGLGDRAFQKTLNGELAKLSAMDPPANNVGLRVAIDYKVQLNARGIVSFAIVGVFSSELACDKPNAECAGMYAFSHNVGIANGLNAAVDQHVIATAPKDFLDVEKARAQLTRVIRDGFAQCVTSDEGVDVLSMLSDAVLTPTGVSIVHDSCSNHVHNAATLTEIPYGKLRPALRAGSPFEDAWR